MSVLAMPPYPWQIAQWQSFTAQLRNNTLPHGLLITGSKGLGLEKLGQAMGQYLLCLAPIDESACGRCKACHLLSAGSHPDFVEIHPEEKSRQIKVDQVRSVNEFMSKTAQQGGRKVVVLYPVEAMNANAANALLKSLEEPSNDTILVLVSLEPSRVLPTIRSRCAIIPMGIPAAAVASEWLQSMGVEDSVSLLNDAGGAPLTAMLWWQDGVVDNRRVMCESLASLSCGTKTTAALAVEWKNYPLDEIVATLISWVERLVKVKMGSVEPDAGVAREWAELHSAFDAVPLEALFRYRDSLCQRKKLLSSGANVNAQLGLEETLLDWQLLARLR
ncbi:DNA polymerase III subunit delta' [Teredinibacter waterburyi]|uniref:DNA polymerase III subunit delta' n=1 Tax=Teredinibacter waterburyi TaxID=1500538 RepID=UPI00165F7837|nr:DNA polymerase III subunit delta' [Teredinibacter waterburyi]